MNVIVSEAVKAELKAIREAKSRHSPGYPKAIAMRIVQRLRSLAKVPLLGSEIPEYANESLRELYESPYRILYRVDLQHVEVFAIIHDSKRLPRTPPG